MSREPNFVFIITGRNALPFAKTCIGSVEAQLGSFQYSVLYVDDGSNYSEEEIKQLQGLLDRVNGKIIRLKERHYQIGSLSKAVPLLTLRIRSFVYWTATIICSRTLFKRLQRRIKIRTLLRPMAMCSLISALIKTRRRNTFTIKSLSIQSIRLRCGKINPSGKMAFGVSISEHLEDGFGIISILKDSGGLQETLFVHRVTAPTCFPSLSFWLSLSMLRLSIRLFTSTVFTKGTCITMIRKAKATI